ncbi:MAG: hypothetical protein AB9872_12915 [Solidesulfovibrio sp.]
MIEAATSDQGSWPWRGVCGMAALALTLLVMALAQSSHGEDDPMANQVVSGSAFGYADASGRQVLVPVESGLARGMKGFRKAVASPGRVVTLSYTGAQHGVDADAVCQTPERFAGTSGAVFSATEPLGSGSDVLVTTDDFLADRQVLAVTPVTPKDCGAAVRDSLAARSGRAVVWCKDVASVEGGGVVSLARFEAKGHEELVTMAYGAPGTSIFLDFPANADPNGTWREGDGGEFSLTSCQPLFAFRSNTGLELSVRWSGPEGDAMDLYRQSGDLFVPFVAASWYRMDE